MGLIKSAAGGAVISLLIANVLHDQEGGDGGIMMISDTTVFGHRIAWSLPLFAIATVLVWLLFKALGESGLR